MDWAYAFDYLSILWVKEAKCLTPDLMPTLHSISRQVGHARYAEIVKSPEYVDLYQANLALFDGVEKVRHGDGMSAKAFDDLNQARHKAKQALQRRFWGSELTEVKT